MSDRLQEIRARLNAAYPGPLLAGTRNLHAAHKQMVSEIDGKRAFIAHAPADIAWLLRRLDFETRLAADLEAQLNRAHQRYAAEVERLRGDEPVAQGATNPERSDG